ncbi:MAG: PQQ-dependent sugar dehydrogenase [Verrucomicrobia bacterium]|nr:PQQ-dependent sugar dehydrogenase [Verrucomicrobiota bacterium]
MPQTPPVYGYQATNAFGNLTFSNPVAILSPPGETNRLFVVEQAGRVAVITNLANPYRTVFLDISSSIVFRRPTEEPGLLGMAFHPGYTTNGYFYIFYTGNSTTTAGSGLHDILSRFQVSSNNPDQADVSSEIRLITQFDQDDNHNAGDLHFGPDGYLYVSLGDEGGGNGQYDNDQRIDKDFFSAILRLDVDVPPRAGSLLPNAHPASTTNYAVPSDNPFVGATSFNGTSVNPANVRTEFWAVGLRNPWRFSFDPATGFLYCADVGQDAWEEVDIIIKGGNFGWAYREGLHAGPKTPPDGFLPTDPILEYGHGGGTNQGFAVMGGVVYRGNRIGQLAGAYVFADYVSGNVWRLHYDGTNATPLQWLFAETGITAFGIDPSNGDVLMADYNLGIIRRLIYSTNQVGGDALPPTLADTGTFANLTSLTPQPGIVPYDINVPFWSDNAIKSRWFSVPNTNLTIGFNRDVNWSFPTGAVWIKHFELELTNGVPASRKRIETRFIVKNATGVYGVTYRWGNSLTNATLVPVEGMDEPFVIDQGGGVLRTQVWHYPSRQECLICHTPAAGYALGFNTPQLNRDYDYAGGATNQIAALSLAGYFNTNVTGIHTLRALAPPTNTTVSLEYRVRSYLAANCSQCHQPGGSAQALWDARITTTTANAGLINGALLDNEGNPNNRVLAPGSPADSMMLTRLSTPATLRMPPLASTVLDTQAIGLVSAWITNDLPGYQSFQDWQIANFGATNAPSADPDADPDADHAKNYLEFLTRTDPTNSFDAWTISIALSNGSAQIIFPQIADRGFEVQGTTNFFDGNSWSALDVAGNAPVFSISNRTAVVEDFLSPSSNKFYRVRVFEP